jgi:hypothetical protein
VRTTTETEYKFSVRGVRDELAILEVREIELLDEEIDAVWKYGDNPEYGMPAGLL